MCHKMRPWQILSHSFPCLIDSVHIVKPRLKKWFSAKFFARNDITYFLRVLAHNSYTGGIYGPSRLYTYRANIKPTESIHAQVTVKPILQTMKQTLNNNVIEPTTTSTSSLWRERQHGAANNIQRPGRLV